MSHLHVCGLLLSLGEPIGEGYAPLHLPLSLLPPLVVQEEQSPGLGLELLHGVWVVLQRPVEVRPTQHKERGEALGADGGRASPSNSH